MFAKFYALIAGLITLMGVLRVAIGYSLIYAPPEEIARYLGSGTTGEAIDKGIYTSLIGLTMLLFAQIAISLQKLVDKK